MAISCLAYSSTLKVEAICSFETLDDLHQATQYYIQEDRTLQFAVLVSCASCCTALPLPSFTVAVLFCVIFCNMPPLERDRREKEGNIKIDFKE
jgi:hypothetical protein